MKVTFYGAIAATAMAAQGAQAHFAEEDDMTLAQFDDAEFASELAAQLEATTEAETEHFDDGDSWAEVDNSEEEELNSMTQIEGKKVKSAKQAASVKKPKKDAAKAKVTGMKNSAKAKVN